MEHITLSKEERSLLSKSQRLLFGYYVKEIRNSEAGAFWKSELRMEVSGEVPLTRKTIRSARRELASLGYIIVHEFRRVSPERPHSKGMKYFCVTLPTGERTFDIAHHDRLRAAYPFLADMQPIPEQRKLPTIFIKLPTPTSTPKEDEVQAQVAPPDYTLFDEYKAEQLNRYAVEDPAHLLALLFGHRLPAVLCCRPLFADITRNCTERRHQWQYDDGRARGTGCGAKGKRPVTNYKGKLHEPRFQEQMLRRLEADPNRYNIALVVPQSMVVIDIDRKNGMDGTRSLAALEEKLGALPPTVRHLSGGGSPHLMFTHTSGRLYNRPIGDGLDLRTGSTGAPALIILTGVHKGGGTNRFESTGRIAELPAGWQSFMEEPPSRKARSRELRATTVTGRDGSRHDELLDRAVYLRSRGESEQVVRRELEFMNESFIGGRKPAFEIENIIDWTFRHVEVFKPTAGT